MDRKVWSSLLIGIALGIFVTGSLYTYLFHDREPAQPETPSNQSAENNREDTDEGSGDESGSDEKGSGENRKASLAIEIEEEDSVEELVYDLMVEGIISSRAQQQEIYEVLVYEGMDPGLREIPRYASTAEIIEALVNP